MLYIKLDNWFKGIIMIIGSFDAKTHFSELIDQAEKGEDIIITRRGKPVAKIVHIPDAAGDDGEASWSAIRRIRNSISGFSAKEANEFRMEGRR
jgi:prevent-host-death family protein